MTSEELAREVMKLATRAAVRVQGTGTDQYLREDGTQEFEHMTPERLLEETIDEAADLISYATMTVIAVQRLIELVARARAIDADVSPGGNYRKAQKEIIWNSSFK